MEAEAMLRDRRGNVLTPKYARIQQLYKAIVGASRRGEPRHVISALRGERDAARNAVRDAFADQYGWEHRQTWFTLHELRNGHHRPRWTDDLWPTSYPNCPIDHAEYFRYVWGPHFPVAIVSHEYGSLENSRAFAKANGLIATRLLASWYNPEGATAVVYTSPLIPFPPTR